MPPLRRWHRVPGVAVLPVAAIGLLPVLARDRIEARVDGPEGMALAIALFIAIWLLVNSALLRLLAAQPQRDGILAGLAAGATMLVVTGWAVLEHDPQAWPIVPLLAIPFGALGVGCGAAAGLLASIGRPKSRAVAVTAIAAGGVILVLAAAFFLPTLAWFGFAPLILIAVGVWGLWPVRLPS